jgi:hypothetical protein
MYKVRGCFLKTSGSCGKEKRDKVRGSSLKIFRLFRYREYRQGVRGSFLKTSGTSSRRIQ